MNQWELHNKNSINQEGNEYLIWDTAIQRPTAWGKT